MARKTNASMPDRIPKSFQNRYDLSGQVGVCTMLDGSKFIFNKSDFNKIKSYKWRFNRGRVISYGEKARLDTDLSHVILQKQLKNPANKNKHIIFLNKDHRDYRRSNLAFATHSQKQAYRKTARNNSSRITGVSFDNRDKRWRAYITVQGKQISLGYYDIKEDAIKARLKGELKYFGKFASQADMFEQYGIIEEDIKNAIKKLNREQLLEDNILRKKDTFKRRKLYWELCGTEAKMEEEINRIENVCFYQNLYQNNYYYE